MGFMILSKEFGIDMDRGIDIKDITLLIKDVVKESKIKEGIVSITSIGSTGSITTIEYEPGVIQDLKNIINEIAPPNRVYEHEKAWHDGNGHSHVQAAIIGPSVSINVKDSRLSLGTWQQIVLINHDVKPRKRRVSVVIIGIGRD